MKAAALTFAILAWTTAALAQGAPSPTAEQSTASGTLADVHSLVGSARASKLIGSSVYRGDSTVGKIEDVLVNLNDRTLSAVILTVGGVLGVGDKRVAVSPRAIKVGAEARFTTDLTKDQLNGAPTFRYEDFDK